MWYFRMPESQNLYFLVSFLIKMSKGNKYAHVNFWLLLGTVFLLLEFSTFTTRFLHTVV